MARRLRSPRVGTALLGLLALVALMPTAIEYAVML